MTTTTKTMETECGFLHQLSDHIKKYNDDLIVLDMKKGHNGNKMIVNVAHDNVVLDIIWGKDAPGVVTVSDGGRTIRQFKERCLASEMLEYAYWHASNGKIPLNTENRTLLAFNSILGCTKVSITGNITIRVQADPDQVVSACYFLAERVGPLEDYLQFTGS